MWTAKETLRALRGERSAMLSLWLEAAQTQLWHLDKGLFTRKGAAARCAMDTFACFVAFYQALADAPPPSTVPPAETPAPDEASGATPATQAFLRFAVLQNCGETWLSLPVTLDDLQRLLELLAHELAQGLRRRGSDEATQDYQMGLLCMVASDAMRRRAARAERELAEYREEMLITQHLANRFLGNASHELRTPLTATLGFAELLQEDTYGELNDAQRTAVGHIENSARNLLEIVNNLLDLLHIRAGKLTLRYHRLVIATQLQQIYEILQPLAKRKNVSFELELADNLETIEADENILRHIVYHLLSSSLRATPAGGRVLLRAERSGPNLALTTEDSALHLPPEAIANMETPFSRLENSPARGYDGWEVGLPLVRRYIDLHGGALDIESLPERGTIFYVTLPLARPKNTPRPEEAATAPDASV